MTTPRTKSLVTTAAARHVKNLARLAMVGWLLASLTGCEKAALDRKVMDLCAKDGGVKVYETVPLTSDLLDRAGRIHIPAEDKAGPADMYYLDWQVIKYIEGNPAFWRDHIKIYRRSDGKLLGEDISYARRGGDLPGPWHESSFRCPAIGAQPQLYPSVFVSK